MRTTLAILILELALLVPSGAGATGLVLVGVPPKTVTVGDEFTVDVVVDAGAWRINAMDAHLSYDPAILRATQPATPGDALPGVMASWSDPMSGTLDVGLWRPGDDAATGTFVLCTLHFQALAVGEAHITSRGLLAAAPGGFEVGTAWAGGMVTVMPRIEKLRRDYRRRYVR